MTIARIPFALGSDEAVSRGYSRQRLLNLYAEQPQTKGKSPVLILGRPGLRPWGECATSGVRGSLVMDDVLYVVSGTALYSVNSAGVATSIGTVPGTGGVVMATNGTQLAIAAGDAWVAEMDGFMIWGSRAGDGTAYLYNRTDASFGEITDPDLFLEGTGKFQISALLDASDYDALDFATAEKSPDALIRGFVDRADLLLFGSETTEVWMNTGNADFPFERQNQAVIPTGIMGRECVEACDKSVFWIGRDPRAGGPTVYRLLGYEAKRVSNHAVEEALEAVTDWDAVRVIAYTIKGHAFFHIIMSDDVSWVYDASTQLWHEEVTYQLGRWIGASHSFVYGRHIVGSFNSGDLFEMDEDYFWDGADTLIEAEMISLPIDTDEAYKVMGRLQVDMETGTTTLTTGQGSDPEIMMAYSDDRGQNWSNEKWRSFGTMGDYGLRVLWRQLGRFRSRMIKLRITDPVPRRFYDYWVDIT